MIKEINKALKLIDTLGAIDIASSYDGISNILDVIDRASVKELSSISDYAYSSDKILEIKKKVADGKVDRQGYKVAQYILNLSQSYCPVETGYLKRNSYIEKDTVSGNFRIVYDAPYAWFVHEIIENRHLAPTKAKFLEDAAFDVLELFSLEVAVDAFDFEMGTDGNAVWCEVSSVFLGDNLEDDDGVSILDAFMLGKRWAF